MAEDFTLAPNDYKGALVDSSLAGGPVSPLQIPAASTLPLSATSSALSPSNPYDEAISRQRDILSSPFQRFLMGPGNVAQVASQMANVQSQKETVETHRRQVALAYMTNTLDALDKFSQMDDETRKTLTPVLGQYLTVMNKEHGVDAPLSVLDALANVPGAAKTIQGLFQDPAISPDEMKSHIDAVRGMKRPEVLKHFQDMHTRKIADLSAQLSTQLPDFAKQVRQQKGLPQGALINPEDVMAAVSQQPAYQQSRLVRAAVENIISGKNGEDALTNAGIIPPSVRRKQMETEVGAGRQQRNQMLQSVQTQMAADPEFAKFAQSRGMSLEQALTQLPLTDLQPFVDKAIKTQQAQKIDVAERTGVGVENAKRDLPIEPKERSQHILISQLQQGRLVMPPAGITRAQAQSNPDIAYVDDKQKERFTALQPTQTILDTMDRLGDQLITAATPSQAFQQGIRLSAAAATKSNPAATAYQAQVDALLGNLARSIGSEKGVLTDRDVTRIKSGMANFYDTKTTRQLKSTILREMLETSQNSLVGEISGKPIDVRGRMKSLMDRMNDADNKALMDAHPGKTLVRKGDQVKELKKGYEVPAGWELVK